MNTKKIGEEIGIKWEEVPFTLDQFEKGINTEMEEHHDDPETKVIDTTKEAGKVAWAHLKEDSKYYDKLDKMEESKNPIFAKIEEGTVTVEDFNKLIAEATPESLRDRVRRRPMAQRRAVKSHQDNETGHSDLQPPKFSGRIDPKREREDRTQNHGHGKSGHRQSARTQKRTMSKSLREYVLSFDKGGYFNNLREEFGKRGYKEGVDFTINGDILSVTEGVQFDQNLQDWMTNVGRAQRIGLDSNIYESTNKYTMALKFILEWYGKPLNDYDELLAEIEDKTVVTMVAKRLMTKPGINRDWLNDFCNQMEVPCQKN